MTIRRSTRRSASIPASRTVRLRGAKLAYASSRHSLLAGERLVRAGQRGPAASVLVTSIEEAIKSLVLSMASEGDRDAEAYLRSALGHHLERLGVGGALFLLTEPWFLIGMVGIGLMAKLLKRDLDRAWTELGLGPDMTASAFADHIWEIRQRAMYVDWVDGDWSSPDSVTEEDVVLLTRVARRMLQLARRAQRTQKDETATAQS